MSRANISDFLYKELSSSSGKYRDHQHYINRELSWIEFNKRVLHQTKRDDVPLLEKLKFLGITASNLDEFIMVRLASILTKMNIDPDDIDISGMKPYDEYKQVFNEVKNFKKLQESCFDDLNRILKHNGILISKYADLTRKEKGYVNRVFTRSIYPLITPIAIDTTKEQPPIRSKQLTIVAYVGDRRNNLNVVALIPINKEIDRVYKIEGENGQDKYILLEEIIINSLHKIFINKNILYGGTMRLLREADTALDDNTDVYIVDRMKQTLLQREYSHPILMDVEKNIPKNVLKLLIKTFDIDKQHVLKTDGIIDLSIFTSMPIRDNDLMYDEFQPQYPEALIGEQDMFTAIDNNDILLHHPYETFDAVVKFLEHASEDKNVFAIKQTLYRISSENSPVVEALCRAAQNGKDVSVLLEIKARFDETRNISLIKKLKAAGCKLIYGIEKLKTHCKFLLVVKKTRKGLKMYSHVATGNYNDATSKVYTDISYFTSNTKVGEDILKVFNILSGFSDPKDTMNKLYFAPYSIRPKLYQLIDKEISNARNGKKAHIILKLNALSDKGIIERLYRASDAGVKVSVICRGVCSMKPINKNIVIRSVIGRYLEHSRIYYFLNSNKPEVFISSADMLSRNLDRRVELLVPITEDLMRNKLLNILKLFFNDTSNSYIMNRDGLYSKISSDSNVDIHKYFMQEAINKYTLKNTPKIPFKRKGM